MDMKDTQTLIQKLDDSLAEWPKEKQDENANYGLMHERYCPNCFSADNILWEASQITLSLGDRNVNENWVHALPKQHDWVTCEMCAYAGKFSEWGPHNELSQPEEQYFKVGEQVCCMRRQSGHGRRVIWGLWAFRAKRGTDHITRWCVQKPVLFKDVKTTKHARQLAKTIGMRFVKTELRHRLPVKTKEAVVHDALATL